MCKVKTFILDCGIKFDCSKASLQNLTICNLLFYVRQYVQVFCQLNVCEFWFLVQHERKKMNGLIHVTSTLQVFHCNIRNFLGKIKL